MVNGMIFFLELIPVLVYNYEEGKESDTMGLFSWMLADTDNTENLRIYMEAHIPCPDGSAIYTKRYDGYGHFGGYDIYMLWQSAFISLFR